MAALRVHETETDLLRLIEQVQTGDEIVILRDDQPVARIVREIPPVKKRPLLGAMKGQFLVDDRFFEPLPEDELALWNGEGD